MLKWIKAWWLRRKLRLQWQGVLERSSGDKPIERCKELILESGESLHRQQYLNDVPACEPEPQYIIPKQEHHNHRYDPSIHYSIDRHEPFVEIRVNGELCPTSNRELREAIENKPFIDSLIEIDKQLCSGVCIPLGVAAKAECGSCQ